ncbi:MAG TPA: cobalt-precorrin-5B (C(1))-methyltransferase [Methanosarcinales archaeon]|nr:cobalt-precorrin-5B (C(1))-methyltransferase [Methanosarcinales archaeon]
MKDPVNNFEIPPEWMRRAAIPKGELEAGIASGRLVLLSDGSVLRRGYTTGTTAAAAAKAAVLSLRRPVDCVTISTPSGINAVLGVRASDGRASATKDSGDHGFDVTNGIEIVAEARESDTISIRAGTGIGVKKGVSAINPVPMGQIRASIADAVRKIGISGADVVISVPKGIEIADQTLNSRVGIVGGISILGTTGFVEPWNEHLLETKQELIQGSDRVVLTTGRIGMRYSNMLFPDHTVVMVGNRISEGIAVAKGEVVLCGLPGLILKWANPDILKGVGFLTIKEMIEEDPANIRINNTLENAKKNVPGVRIVLLNPDGSTLRDTDP